MSTDQEIAYRGSIFYFRDSAQFDNLARNKEESKEHYVYHEDGVLVVQSGIVKKVGSYADMKNQLANMKVVDYQRSINYAKFY